MPLSHVTTDQLPGIFKSPDQKFLSLLEGLAGYGTNLGNKRVKDLMRSCAPEDGEVRRYTINRIVQYVQETFDVDSSEETAEEIAEVFFESYPHWSVFFTTSWNLRCKADLDEGTLRQTSVDWRCWTARMDQTFDILNPVNTELRTVPEKIKLRLHPELSNLGLGFELKNAGAVEETQLKTWQLGRNQIFASGFAIGVALTGACFPLIVKFAPGLVQSPDYPIPVLEQERK